MPWLLYICIFFSLTFCVLICLLLLTVTLRGYLISIAYCLFFSLVEKLQRKERIIFSKTDEFNTSMGNIYVS